MEKDSEGSSDREAKMQKSKKIGQVTKRDANGFVVNKDDDLPNSLQIDPSITKGKEYFLKTYKMQQGVHMINPDSAQNVKFNIYKPITKRDLRKLREDPYFSQSMRKEKHNDMSIVDLIKCQ